MHGNHWSLILFTLLAQTAAGTMIIRAILRYFFADSGETPSIQPAFRISLIISSTAMIMAALVSFFHLGSPLHAIYVLNNLAASWLSREILSVILFTGSLCLLTLLHIIDFRRKKLMLALEITTIILGLVLVFTMSRIYMLATVPVWNHIFTPLAFFGSTFLLGTAVWTLMMAYERELAKNTAQVIGYFCVAFGAIQLSLSMFHFLHLTELGIYPSRFCTSSSYSLAASIFIARSRLACCERSVWQATTIPDGTCVMRTADSVLLTCWPPAPDER